MEHVSTLCAISTVGIAATGFALGRVDPPSSSSKPGLFRRKTLPLPDHCAPPSSRPESASSATRPPRYSKPATIKETESVSNINPNDAPEKRVTSVCQTQDQIPRKGSLAVRLRRRGQTLTNPPARVSEDQPLVSHTRRPSSSWLRRLSIVSFQSEGRFTPSPVSPSFPVSPGQFRPTSQRRLPNKLVKRPPSQHSNAPPLLTPPPSSTTPTFRRPATSYQRPGQSHHRATHSLTFEPTFAALKSPVQSISIERPPELANHSSDWQPYLNATTGDGLPEKLARRLSTAGRPKDHRLRRILPSADAVPALLLASSVSNRELATNGGNDQSIPATPATPITPITPASPFVQFRDPFQSANVPALRPESPFPPEKRSCETSQSVDEAELKPLAMCSNATDAGTPHDGATLVQAKRRIASNPVPELSNLDRANNVNSVRRHERRNITDPSVFRRPPTGSQAEFSAALRLDSRRQRRSLVLPSTLSRDFSAADMGRDTAQRSSTSDQVAPSALQNGSYRPNGPAYSPPVYQRRAKRHSIAASDPASTVMSSDETRIFTSGDEDETDFLTDTAFDSIRTHHTTTSNSGLYGPRIESIFDHSSAVAGLMNEGLVKLEDLIPRGSFTTPPLGNDGCVSGTDVTPIHSPDNVRRESTDTRDDETRLSLLSDLSDDEDARSMIAALPSETNDRFFQSMRPSLPLEAYQDEPSASSSPRDLFDFPNDSIIPSVGYETRSLNTEALGAGPKMNIFDWSEQPKNDRDMTGSDVRPRTVHAKQGPELRGSRVSGRKAPSSLHLRSQSVPSVTRDPSLANESRQTSGKFGTWGLGTKGVSEDWDSDFDFDDKEDDEVGEDLELKNDLPQSGMMVPQAILERQDSLRGQFGQVQELTLLVQELKRLRHQGSSLNLVHGPSSELWKEAEGIVDLATLDDDDDDDDDDDHNESPPRSPSSLTFSFDDSEGESANMNDPSKRISGESWPASLSDRSNPGRHPSSGRPNQASTTKAKSVLDLIYQQRVANESALNGPHASRSQKLPFDTQSLRDLVTRAGVITRALKEVIRKAEQTTRTADPEVLPSDPPFSQIFNQPTNDNFSNFETRCVG